MCILLVLTTYAYHNARVKKKRKDMHTFIIARSKRDGTRAETRFGLSAKRTSPFKSAGVSVQSTTGSRGVRISGQQLYRPCSDVQCKAADYPLHSHLSPSLPLPCVTVCHQIPNALYQQIAPVKIHRIIYLTWCYFLSKTFVLHAYCEETYNIKTYSFFILSS